MTDTPPKPKRRRWRWLVVGMLFVCVGVARWNWSPGNPRLAGKWSVAAAGDKGGPYTTYVFHPNGVLEDLPPGETPLKLAWSTSGDDLFISSEVPAPLLMIWARLPQMRSARVEHLFLKQIDDDHFTMGYARQYDYDIELTRLPE